MPAGLVVKVNNFGFLFTFTVLDAKGNPRDLSSVSVTLYVYTQEQLPTLLFSGACVVVPPSTAGICTYLVKSTDFPTIGTWDAELEITDTVPPIPPTLILEDTETFSINVIPAHPRP